jgi:hypothetical protein
MTHSNAKARIQELRNQEETFSPRPSSRSMRSVSFLEHEVSRQGSFDSLKSTNDERKSRPATSCAGNTHSAARVGRMGAVPSPTISSGTPLEMLRRKAQKEKMQRIEAARASVKQRLHAYTASVSFKQLSGAEQASFWVGSSQGPPNLSEEYANASRECMLLSAGNAEFARLPAVPQEEEQGEVQHTPPAAQSKAWKSWVMDPEDDLFGVGSGW